MTEPTAVSQHKCFDGTTAFYQHPSAETGGDMRFAVYTPPQAETGAVPVLYYLAGLTCTEETFMIKAGAQRLAAAHGLMLVAPDTSPRDAGIEGEDDSYDFGTGAGFYLDATKDPWRRHYRMYSYVTKELPAIIGRHFPGDMERQGIFGHSMGGHGALTVALKNPDVYKSVSAFAPVAAPKRCPWGQKAFSGYLQSEREWDDYDASELVRKARDSDKRPILIDQGTADQFLAEQLYPEAFKQACEAAGRPLTLRYHDGYDHGYYFIATVMADHMQHHADILLA